MNEVETISCNRLLEDRPIDFEGIEKIVYGVAKFIADYAQMQRVNLLANVNSFIRNLA